MWRSAIDRPVASAIVYIMDNARSMSYTAAVEALGRLQGDVASRPTYHILSASASNRIARNLLRVAMTGTNNERHTVDCLGDKFGETALADQISRIYHMGVFHT